MWNFIFLTLLTRVYVLARFDVFRLYGMFMGVFIVQQLVSIAVEHIIWGKSFVHWFDVAFLLGLFWAFAFVAYMMAGTKVALKKAADDVAGE